MPEEKKRKVENGAVAMPEESVLVKDRRGVNDPVHGLIHLPGLMWKIIDTREFQRLRNLKQVGAAYFIYPGAQHSRFEHSLGVCHLSMTWLKILREHQPDLDITDKEILLVGIAGLCHDLGHGPFSHLFDCLVQETLPELKWSHEKGSCQLFERIVDKTPGLGLSDEDVRFVKNLILGKSSRAPQKREFLFEIVNNEKCGLDVDKLDYLQRDALFCHVDSINSATVSRIMTTAKIMDYNGKMLICFPEKVAADLYSDVFHQRFKMHKKVYQNDKVKAVELMLQDIFYLASKTLKFSNVNLLETVGDMDIYSKLNDSVIDLIQQTNGEEQSLKEAKIVIDRLYTRKLYKSVGWVNVPVHYQDETEEGLKSLVSEQIMKHFDVKSEDFIVELMKVHHGMKNRNPVDGMLFFKKNSSEVKPLKDEKWGKGILPNEFETPCLRVFAKNLDKVREISKGFRKWTEDIQVHSPICTSQEIPNGNTGENELVVSNEETQQVFMDSEE